jgi:hypothetical protein
MLGRTNVVNSMKKNLLLMDGLCTRQLVRNNYHIIPSPSRTVYYDVGQPTNVMLV